MLRPRFDAALKGNTREYWLYSLRIPYSNARTVGVRSDSVCPFKVDTIPWAPGLKLRRLLRQLLALGGGHSDHLLYSNNSMKREYKGIQMHQRGKYYYCILYTFVYSVHT